MNRRVVITGMGIVSPLGQSIDSAYARLKVFENCIKKIDELSEYEGLNSQLGCLSEFTQPTHWNRKTTRTLGDVAMYALAATEQAISDAKLDEATLQNGRTGVAYGSCSGSIPAHLDFLSLCFSHKVEKINSTTYVKLMDHTAACNISVHFKTHGRLVPTGTACTSGSLAIGSAYELIKFGKQDVMIAGGAEEFSVSEVAMFDTLYATSLKNEAPEKTPAPYSADRDGLVIGDGACTLILEEREHAIARGAKIYAEVVGFCESTDGTHVTNPNPETMASALKGAIEDAGISPDVIGYVNGHGTATKNGDIAETQATYAVFQRPVSISSTKSYIGHTLGACGAIEAAMTILSMNEGWFHPNLNFTSPDPECASLDYLTGDGKRIDTDYVMSNNFAFGGVNTSLIFKKVK